MQQGEPRGAASKRRLLIRVYGDSLSLPRPADGIRHFHTYPELLRDAFESSEGPVRVALYNRAIGAASITDLHRRFVQDSAHFESDESLLIIQCGVVDCAPRPLPPAGRAAVSRMPTLLRWLVVKVLHVLRPLMLRAGLSWRRTEADRFRGVLARWLDSAQGRFRRVFMINIAPTLSSIEAHSPGLASSIAEYNNVIADVVAGRDARKVVLIDVHAAISNETAPRLGYVSKDGHHITPLAHELYARLIHSAEVSLYACTSPADDRG